MRRKDLETAATNLSYLRGLLFVPLGMLPILAALANWEVGPLRHTWAFPIVAVAIGALCLPIVRWYDDHYGRVTPSTRQQLRGAAAGVLGLAVVVAGSTLLRSRASWSLDLPVNATAVTFALIMLISYGVCVGLKTHHVIICGSLLVAGALPVWNGADPSNIGLLLVGVAVMLSGFFDHRLFVETFGPPTALDLEEHDAEA
jgi:hypothetical protein